MVKFDRVTIEPQQLNGQPYIKGTKITIRRVLHALATYLSREDILREYPELEEEDIRQAIEFATANLDNYDMSIQELSAA